VNRPIAVDRRQQEGATEKYPSKQRYELEKTIRSGMMSFFPSYHSLSLMNEESSFRIFGNWHFRFHPLQGYYNNMPEPIFRYQTSR
jgi:hypothetical protein